MPRIGITAYDLLVSCPGDVIEYVDIIRECVDNFNRTIGEANNSVIEVKHWSTNSYPESGDKAQELLNKQFVRNCDAAVALFWTRFGTPTDKFGSGTEEEIEEMLSSDKQVFMYFLDAPINPSKLDSEQHAKVLAFRKKYESRGIYSVVNDKISFRQQFTNHLTMHFLHLFSGEKSTFEKQFKPNIIIQNDSLKMDSEAIVETTHFLESKFLVDKRITCIEKLKSLQSNNLPPRTTTISDQADSSPANEAEKYIMSMSAYKPSDLHNEIISDKMKTVITNFASENSIVIEPSFWNVGNLKKVNSLLSPPFGGGVNLLGNQEEKQRYESIKKLYWDIQEYLEYIDFFSYVDKNYYVNLVVTNNGNTFDEDIDVKIMVDKGLIVHPDDIILPDINIIENILKIGFIEFAFTIKENDIINSYSEYPTIMQGYNYSDLYPFGKSATEEYKEQKEEFKDEINRVFCYKYFNKEDSDIMSFHINYLKHNTTIAFPSVLVFKDIPKEIEYEITSKHTPNIAKGKIQIIHNSLD